MNDIEQCKRHGLPADWCGPCNAALEERERVLALLEEEREKHIPWCGEVQPCPKCYQTIGLETAIALIKGENE